MAREQRRKMVVSYFASSSEMGGDPTDFTTWVAGEPWWSDADYETMARARWLIRVAKKPHVVADTFAIKHAETTSPRTGQKEEERHG